MKLIIVHYHLRPGGIRRVIELAAPPIRQRLGDVGSIVLACGEAGDLKWNENFARQLQPTPVEFFVEPAFNYVSEQKLSAARLRVQVATGVRRLLAGLSEKNSLVWAHNLGVGRNLILTRALPDICTERGIPLISHHHDWWFENRWRRWPEMRRSGARTLAAAAGIVFPTAPTIRHAAINRADAAVLRRHFPGQSAWLPNLVERHQRLALEQVRTARSWLRKQLGGDAAPVWILPCRLLRRKNAAEALLLTRWLRPEAWLVTTGGISSADERAYHAKLSAAALQQRWRLRLGVLAGDETLKPGVPEIIAASECVLLTSVQEGFGLPYLEAAAAGRPLIARSLPNIAPDLAEFGFRFPQCYEELLIHCGLFDVKAERARQAQLFRVWLRRLPRVLQQRAGEPFLLEASESALAVPFSRLTLTAQLEVLAQPVPRSWELCAPLNPWLSRWRQRAARGQLQITPWPRTADRWLSPEHYAERFCRLARSSPASPVPTRTAIELQAEFVEKKLAGANVYPLLWLPDT